MYHSFMHMLQKLWAHGKETSCGLSMQMQHSTEFSRLSLPKSKTWDAVKFEADLASADSELCSATLYWLLSVLNTFINSDKRIKRKLSIFCVFGSILMQAISIVAFQKGDARVPFLTANINCFPFESKYLRHLKR